MRCLKELEGLRVAKLMCFARRTSTRRPAQCGWRWSREGAKDAKRGCGNGRLLVWPGMCGIGSGGGVTEPCRRSGHPRHSPRRALESLQDAVGNAAPYRLCRRVAPQPPAGNPPGSGNGDSCLELGFILDDCRSIDAEGGQAPGGEAEGLLQFGYPLFRHVADPDLAGCAGGFHRDHSRLA